jgi:hypothetical protein
MSAVCCYLRRRNLCAIFTVAGYVELDLLPNTSCSTILTIEASRKPVVITHWPGHWVLATGQQPSFIYSLSCFFLMGFSSVIFICLPSCIKEEVNSLGGRFSARELGTKVPMPRVLKQPLNCNIPYPPTIPHTVEFCSCLPRCAWHS